MDKIFVCLGTPIAIFDSIIYSFQNHPIYMHIFSFFVIIITDYSKIIEGSHRKHGI